MSRIHVAALLALSTLALPTSAALAQAIFSGPSAAPTTGNQGSASEKDVPQCQGAPGGSRMRKRDRGGCQEVAEAVERAEQQIDVTLELPQSNEIVCEATTRTEYSQRNTVARVTGTVSVTSCPAGSAGTFDLVARIKDESGETKPIEFPQSWQRSDKGDESFAGDYAIGENVELVNVRVRNLKCTCAVAPEVTATATEPAPPN